jgi:hypothetical protein
MHYNKATVIVPRTDRVKLNHIHFSSTTRSTTTEPLIKNNARAAIHYDTATDQVPLTDRDPLTHSH